MARARERAKPPPPPRVGAWIESQKARAEIALYVQSLRRFVAAGEIWMKGPDLPYFPAKDVWSVIVHEHMMMDHHWQMLRWGWRDPPHHDVFQEHRAAVTWSHRILSDVFGRHSSPRFAEFTIGVLF